MTTTLQKLAVLMALLPAMFLPCALLLTRLDKSDFLFGLSAGFWGGFLMLVMIALMGAVLGVACTVMLRGNELTRRE